MLAQRKNKIAESEPRTVPRGQERAKLHSPCSYPLIAFSVVCLSARGAVSRSMVARDSRHSDPQAHSVPLLLRQLWAPQLRWSRTRLLELVQYLP